MASNAATLRPALTSEVRKLKSRHVAALGRILSGQEDWKTLMGSVRAEPENPDSPFKFTAEDVRYAYVTDQMSECVTLTKFSFLG